ncbi:hypothetical protein [Candidatus Palauibacter polyketidifaciens]|uniref:hypothetical protein n=1 Tax=Candidatus Palauibacter polyketidifaciens TaxID=3056740 RepID=UPI00239C06E0|nr:hypothetical protein [Candidatus Palauibacter polyketidifaciens]MDE2719788.1 hypothetical protein [Candidatus Palauibacter polyketidifaciens]
MPGPKADTPEAGADAGRTRVDPRRSRTRVQPTGATDGITITRWSLGLFITFALSVVTAAFTLVWNQTLKLGDTQVQLVAHVAGLDARMISLETRVAGVETEVRDLRAEVRVEIGGLREQMRELAELIRDPEPPRPPSQ